MAGGGLIGARRARLGVLAAAWLTLLAAAVLVLARAALHDWRNGDTAVLASGLAPISRCLHDLVLVGCNAHLAGHGAVSQFPLLQQALAYLLHEARLDDSMVIAGLVWLNALVVVGLAAGTVAWAYRRSGMPLAVLAGLLLVPGMLVAYTASSFGEPVAVAVFCAVVLSALRPDRPSRFLAVAAVLATVSKDTAAPFVLLLGVAALGLSGASRPVLRRAFLHLCVGVATGVLLVAVFNEFRYGTLLNHIYLSFPRASPSMLPSNAFGMLVSPNAGIAWFWPGVAVAVVVLLTALVRPPAGLGSPRRVRISAALGLLSFAAIIGSLADWWAPFGWYAWGPRLLMPSAGAMIPLVLPLIDQHRLRRTRLAPAGLATLALLAGAAVLPNAGIVFDHGAYTAQVTATWRDRPVCSPAVRVKTRQDGAMCNRRMTWRTTSMPLTHAVTGVASRYRGRYWTVVALSWASIVLWLTAARAAAVPARSRLGAVGDPEAGGEPTTQVGDPRESALQPAGNSGRRYR